MKSEEAKNKVRQALMKALSEPGKDSDTTKLDELANQFVVAILNCQDPDIFLEYLHLLQEICFSPRDILEEGINRIRASQGNAPTYN